MIVLTDKERKLLEKYDSLTSKDKSTIISMHKDRGMTVDEIARRYEITPPDVNRILHPPSNYGKWTAEEKMRHWVAGQRRSQTVKKNRDKVKEDSLKTMIKL